MLLTIKTKLILTIVLNNETNTNFKASGRWTKTRTVLENYACTRKTLVQNLKSS